MWENAKRCCYTVVEAPTVTSNKATTIPGDQEPSHTRTRTHTHIHTRPENLESGCQDCKLAQPQHVLNFVVSELCLEFVRVVRGPRGALGGSFWRGFCGRQQQATTIETAATSATTTATAVLGFRLQAFTFYFLLYSACFCTLVFGSRLFRNETWQLDAT